METATVAMPESVTPSSRVTKGNTIQPRRVIDWQPIRDAFIKRPERSTYDELAEEFAVSRTAIASTSSDEGWPILRAQFFESQLEKADAGQILISALSSDRALSQRGATFGMRALDSLLEILNHPKMETYSPSTKAEVANTCTFAFINVARGLRELGVTGISKTLDQAGKEGNGQWNPQMLQQINVNVGEIIAKVTANAKPAEQAAKPVSEPTPTS